MDDFHSDLTEVKISLARMEERQELQPDLLRAAIREAVSEALSPAHKRLDAIEKDVAKAKAWGAAIAVLAGAAAWVFEHGAKFLAPLAVLLAGCAAVTPGGGWPATLRPVSVLIARDLPSECRQAAFEAVEFWQGYVDYLEVVEPLATEAPRLGEVSFQSAPLPGDLIGQARWRHLPNGDFTRATVTLERCDGQTAAHELAHALGLDHGGCPSLMCPYENPSWDLTDAEIEAVQ